MRIQILAEIEKTEKTIIEDKEMTKPVAPDVAISRISRMDAINNNSVKELLYVKQKKNWRNYNMS